MVYEKTKVLNVVVNNKILNVRRKEFNSELFRWTSIILKHTLNDL